MLFYLCKMQKFKFSGHETFICKQLWFKKGYDFIADGNKFSDEDAIIKLGVGKNMVSSIKFWMKAVGLLDENDVLTEIAKLILCSKGWDPFTEDIGTLWLFHYLLIKTDYASLYNIVFNDFGLQRNEFTKEHLIDYLKRLSASSNTAFYNAKIIDKDINVLIRNYIQQGNKIKKSSLEDEFSGFFQELNLIKRDFRENFEKKVLTFYILERADRPTLPIEIFLYAVIDNIKTGNVVSFNELFSGNNSVGNVFQMSREGIFNKIEELTKKYNFIDFSQTAGTPTIHLKEKPNLNDILTNYYEH